MSAEFEGWDEIKQKIQNIPGIAIPAVGSALFMEGEELISASKPLVPVNYGTLRRSGHVNLPATDQNGNIFVDAGFGGPAGSGNQGESNEDDVGYAIPVHENLEAHHNVGQAKYLEQPFDERKDGVMPRLISRVKLRLGD